MALRLYAERMVLCALDKVKHTRQSTGQRDVLDGRSDASAR